MVEPAKAVEESENKATKHERVSAEGRSARIQLLLDAATMLDRLRKAPKALALFVATVISVFITHAKYSQHATGSLLATLSDPRCLRDGSIGAVSLLGILLAHEFGHYFAARWHRVPASFPHFIPLPLVSRFGTLGAVIGMRTQIQSRRALFDVGASGPVAGILVAVPLYLYGVHHSPVIAVDPSTSVTLGNSLLLTLLDRLAAPTILPGTDVMLSPMAFSAWGGMFITMMNLLPFGQLDGGHVAHATFGKSHARVVVWLHRGLPLLFLGIVATRLVPELRRGEGLEHLPVHVSAAIPWFAWFEFFGALALFGSPDLQTRFNSPLRCVATVIAAVVSSAMLEGVSADRRVVAWAAWVFVFLAVLIAEYTIGIASKRMGSLLQHPPCNQEPLGNWRSLAAAFMVLLFVALLMPTPMSFG
jgi:hypothetical protein